MGKDIPVSLCRARAVVQHLNTVFAQNMRSHGHKYVIDTYVDDDVEMEAELSAPESEADEIVPAPVVSRVSRTIKLTKPEAIKWVHKLLSQTRGKELPGNFNPLLVGELFWEQSTKWASIASTHVDSVAQFCRDFLKNVLETKCPKDVQERIWESIEDDLKLRKNRADHELGKLISDLTNYPINYNHYYTDTINKRRQARQISSLEQSLDKSTTSRSILDKQTNQWVDTTSTDFKKMLKSFSGSSEADMEKVSCQEALDALFAIYKVSFQHLLIDLAEAPANKCLGVAKKLRGQRYHPGY